jgi:hypothetical protein
MSRPAGAAADRNQAMSGMITEHICGKEYWSNSLKRSWCNKILGILRLRAHLQSSYNHCRGAPLRKTGGWECWRSGQLAVLHEHRGKAHRQECLCHKKSEESLSRRGSQIFLLRREEVVVK